MENSFHKNKIYRVKEKKNRKGETRFIVESADSFIGSIFGLWSEYVAENETLDDAINHIKFLDGYRLESEKVVYKEKVK